MRSQPGSVSVVIPTCNRADLCVGAAVSALEQTCPPLEVIIVDDASVDATPGKVQGLTDTRVRYLRHEVNRGASAARNTGIDAARGEWIAFLDDDDHWHPRKLEIQLQRGADYDLVLCGSRYITQGAVDRRFGDHVITARRLRRGYLYSGGTSNLLVRRDFARQLYFDPHLPCGQDWDFLIRAVNAGRALYISEPLVEYNDQDHRRITNSGIELGWDERYRRAAVVFKHRQFLGPFWFDYNLARFLLAFIGLRRRRLHAILHATRRCGVPATLLAIGNKVTRRLVGGGAL